MVEVSRIVIFPNHSQRFSVKTHLEVILQFFIKPKQHCQPHLSYPRIEKFIVFVLQTDMKGMHSHMATHEISRLLLCFQSNYSSPLSYFGEK